MSTCRQIHRLLLAEPDGTLGSDEQAHLAAHLAVCPACRRQKAVLSQTPALFREADASVTVPDPAAEWRDVRARLHSHAPAERSLSRRMMPWGLTLAAGAAACLAFVVWRGPSPVSAGPSTLARAEYVQAEGSDSTLVYVDEESGWLIVWADRRPGDPTG
jgi:anti-sigma factor RsiW